MFDLVCSENASALELGAHCVALRTLSALIQGQKAGIAGQPSSMTTPLPAIDEGGAHAESS